MDRTLSDVFGFEPPYPGWEYEEALVDPKFSALWADQYALSMSQAFFTNGKHNLNTTFHGYIRSLPFSGGYLVTGGQNIVFEWLRDHWRFDAKDMKIMRHKTILNPLTGERERFYTDPFCNFVETEPLRLTIDAMPEGELAFPDEPIWRVHGPLWQCLMVEAAILNATNSQSLFATLASRIKEATRSSRVATFNTDPDKLDPVLEFGLRRAQCIHGLEPTRASWIGGIDGTSNMNGEKFYGIPARGTFAHALVMTYESELQAFSEYAQAMPFNGIFLVDTYNTLEGVKKAIKACKAVEEKTGRKNVLKGIRLDSGDLAYFSIEARKLLDEAGYTDAKIAASNDLDEAEILKLKHEGARIDIWGVGTNLVTSSAQPALGAVFKLGAVFDGNLSQSEIEATRRLIKQGENPANENFVRNVIKLAERDAKKPSIDKSTLPGELDVIRLIREEGGKPVRFNGDIIVPNLCKDFLRAANDRNPFPFILDRDITSVKKHDSTDSKTFKAGARVYRPLVRAFDQGSFVTTLESVHHARARLAFSLAMLAPDHRKLSNPYPYGVGVEEEFYIQRDRMIRQKRREAKAGIDLAA